LFLSYLPFVGPLDQYVTEESVERRIQSLEKRETSSPLEQDNIRVEAIEQIIDEYILMYEAKANGFSVSGEEVQEVIDSIIETAKEAQNENFQSLLDEMGMTVEEYYNEYAYESIKGKLLENKLYDDITSKGESWNEYKKEVIRDYRKNNEAQIKKLMKKLK
jgi:hypothetical protein